MINLNLGHNDDDDIFSINININESSDEKTKDEPFNENIIDDSLKAAEKVGINGPEIKKDWEASSKSFGDGLQAAAGTIDSAGKLTDTIDRTVLKRGVQNANSIIARARNSILQFPIYISEIIRKNEATLLSRLFERVYATYVQTVVSLNPIMSEDEANNLVFLKKFHSNIHESAEVLINKYYEAIDDFDQMMQDSIFYTEKLSPNCIMECRIVPMDNDIIIKESARLSHDFLDGFAYLKEAGDKGTVTINNTIKNDTVSDEELLKIALDRGVVEKDKDGKENKVTTFSAEDKKLAAQSIKDVNDEIKAELAITDKSSDDDQKKFKEELKKRMNKKREVDKNANKALEDLKKEIRTNGYEGMHYNRGRVYRSNTTVSTTTSPTTPHVTKAVDAPVLLKDGDIKKSNDLAPMGMEVTFRMKTGNGMYQDVKYILGIKCILHPIKIQDLAEDLNEIVTGNIKSLRKVKYKTGEMSFKDYFLNLKSIKADATKSINYNKRWINTCKRLAEFSRTNGSLFKGANHFVNKGDIPFPNGTLVLTRTDVVTLANETGIDISNVNTAKTLARNLFLIGICIVDNTDASMSVLYPDMNSTWDVQSLATIESDLAKTDNSQLMKELNRMVNR